MNMVEMTPWVVPWKLGILVSCRILHEASRSLLILYSVIIFFSSLLDQRERKKDAMVQIRGSSREPVTSRSRVRICAGVMVGRNCLREERRRAGMPWLAGEEGVLQALHHSILAEGA